MHNSTGAPTLTLLLIVESMETIAAAAAIDNVVVCSTTRSSIGLPYLLSPICRKGVSSDVVMKLPCG